MNAQKTLLYLNAVIQLIQTFLGSSIIIRKLLRRDLACQSNVSVAGQYIKCKKKLCNLRRLNATIICIYGGRVKGNLMLDYMRIEEYDKYRYSSTGKFIEKKGKFEPSTFCAAADQVCFSCTQVSWGLGILPEDELAFRRTQKKFYNCRSSLSFNDDET